MRSSQEVPLVTRLARLVRDAAAQGEGLGSEPALADRLGVSRPRLREALAALERDGLIRRSQGRSTVINLAGLDIAGRLDRQVDFGELLRESGRAASTEVLDAEVSTVPERFVDQLGAEAGAAVWHVRKRWLADGVPAMISDDYLLLPEGAATVGSPPGGLDPSRSLFDTASRLWGEALAWEVVLPGAERASAADGLLLGLGEGDPVLTLELLGITSTGRRAFVAQERHRPNTVRFGFIRTFS